MIAITDPSITHDLLTRWARFVDSLQHDDVFELIGTEDVVGALIERSLLERQLESDSRALDRDGAQRLLRSDHAFRAAAPAVLEQTDIALFKDDEPATDWWWRVEELVLKEAGEALLNVPDAARLKGVHPHTLRSAIKDGALPARRLARGFLVRRRDLERWQPKRVGRPARRPTHGDALLEAFNQANTGRDFTRAHEIARALARDPSTPRRCVALALDAYNGQEYEDAEVWSRRALRGELPEHSRQTALLVLGRSLLNLDRAREALRALREASTLHGVEGFVRASLADAHLALGRTKKAVEEAQKATEHSPDVPEMKYVLARMEWHDDRLWDALEHVIEYRSERPDDVEGIVLHGSVLGLIADRTKDAALYRRCVDLGSLANREPNLDALRLRGQSLARLGYWRRAFADARRILELGQNDPDPAFHAAEHIVYDALEVVIGREGNSFAAAVAAAGRLLGDTPGIARKRALAYARRGDVRRTLAALATDADAILHADANDRLIVAIAYAVAEKPDMTVKLLADTAPSIGEPATLLLLAQAAIASRQFDLATQLLDALAGQEGIAGDVAQTALKLLEARQKRGERGLVSLASGFAAAKTTDFSSAATGATSAVESGWEGRHPMVTPVLDRLAPKLLLH